MAALLLALAVLHTISLPTAGVQARSEHLFLLEAEQPSPISPDLPQLTPIAVEAGVKGTVILETRIKSNGRVQSLRVLKGLPLGLSEAAVEAVKNWRFEPVTRNDMAVPASFHLRVEFDAPPRFVRKGDQPRPVSTTTPRYPQLALETKVQGDVILKVTTDKMGEVSSVELLKGLPMGISQAAMDAVRQWRYQPVHIDGEPISVMFHQVVSFRQN